MMQIEEAQEIVKKFAESNGWKDEPNIDKFDHLHEELLEMSRHLRYRSLEERNEIIKEKHDIFEDGIGDLVFAVLRLSNQLGVNAEEAFGKVSESITKRYAGKSE